MLTSWQEPTVVIIVVDVEGIDADLAAGAVACPRCGTPLRPWSYARTRTIRQLDGSGLRVRPRRARCPSCGQTQVLLARFDAAAACGRDRGRGCRVDGPGAGVRQGRNRR
ncbi:hypothetical protein [Micromonospora fulviviridis]|uniref:Transposase family protein n=1 Tax=Micromonospora fulviviridis TaxID=47860 RepID=A0ABV2VXM3_9ACTN